MSNQTIQDQGTAGDVLAYVQQELAAGKSRAEIANQLMANGWTAQQANEAAGLSSGSSLTDLAARAGQAAPARPAAAAWNAGAAAEQTRARGRRKMIAGACWCIGGTVITAVTYAMAANNPGGGTYFVAWGAILFGAIDFIRGAIIYASA